MYLSRCIVSFRDTKTTTGTTTKLFIRPDNLRVLVLGFIDLLLLQPAQKFIPPHQQPVADIKRRKSCIMEYPIGGRARDTKVKTYTFQNKRQAVLFCGLPFLLTQSDLRGLGYTPEMRLWIPKRCACKTHLPQNGSNQTGQPYEFV